MKGIFENIIGFTPQLSTQLVSKTSLLTWLLVRIQSKTHDENRGYAAEILSIILQNNADNRLELGKEDGVETLLTVLSVGSFLFGFLGDHAQNQIAISSKRPRGH
jgi:beta-catenin-like protein 1